MITSMTGFARASGYGEWGNAIWELRSVNHRYLEINLHLPELLRELDPLIREYIYKHLQRGKVDVMLRYTSSSQQQFTIDTPALDKLIQTCSTLHTHTTCLGSLNPLELLRWPGILQASILDEETKKAIFAILENALQTLCQTRLQEGQALQQVLLRHIGDFSTKIQTLLPIIPTILQAHREKLMQRFNELKLEIDQNRLEQEMLLLANKMDVQEELERLQIHLNEFKQVLQKGGTVGKRLDFLLQEFNREVNTLGSKMLAVETTQAVVDMKVLIEQLREQIQNIE